MSQTQRTVQLTLLERLDLIPAVISLLGTLLYSAITGPFRGTSGAYTYKQHVIHSGIRKFAQRFNTAQAQYLTPTFGTIYTTWCKNNNLTPSFIRLPSTGCQAFWTGDPQTAKYILVYFHGGGFSLDGDDNHLNYWYGMQMHLAKSKPSISLAVLFVEYTLVPHGTYPIQMREGVDALSYVLHTLNRSPNEILLGGDSAGGNMCLAVLSHLTHPAPDCSPLTIDRPLKGIICVAPWVSFDTSFPSVTRNAHKDIVSRSGGIMWSSTYLAGLDGGYYTEPHKARSSWWEGAMVEDMLVVAGSDEILADSIAEWVEKYRSVNPGKTTYVVGRNETHIAPIIQPGFGNPEETEQGKAIKEWLKAKL